MPREGYWFQKHLKEGSELPKPVPRDKPWKGKRKFLAALAKKEAMAYKQSFKGWSECRLCGCKNGSQEFQLLGWEWPTGFRHYVEKHNVRPSLAFQEFILGEYLH